MRTFLSVVETGSVSAAARAIGLTQPAASQQLQELERILGVRLLDRAGGRAQPTAAGEAVIAAARRALAATGDVLDAAAAHRSGQAGRVRLGTGATACIHLLPPVLAAVRRRVPGIDVSVITGNTDAMVQQVEAGELDLALVTLPAPRSRALTVSPLRRDPLVALMPDAMAPRAGRAIRPADLAARPLILYETGGNVRRIVDDWFRRAGVRPKAGMELGSVEAIKGLVQSGLGCSILPSLALAGEIPGTVQRPLSPVLARELATVLRNEKILDAGLRALLDELDGIRDGGRRR